MGGFQKPLAELPHQFQFRPQHPGDWIDMEFVLQEVEEELRGEVLAVGLETMANVYRSMAEGAAKAANLVRGGGAQQERG